MNNFDFGNLAGLLGGMQQKMAEMKQKQAALRCEGSAGGVVKVVATGAFQIESIEIDPAALDDAEMLEDLVRAAVNEAMRKVGEEMQANAKALTGGLPIPPGMLGF